MQKFYVKKHPLSLGIFLEQIEDASTMNTMCGNFDKDYPAEIRLLGLDGGTNHWVVTKDVVTSDHFPCFQDKCPEKVQRD